MRDAIGEHGGMVRWANEFGLPLCLLQIEPSQTMAVLEMGMSAKGEIRKLASIAEPAVVPEMMAASLVPLMVIVKV